MRNLPFEERPQAKCVQNRSAQTSNLAARQYSRFSTGRVSIAATPEGPPHRFAAMCSKVVACTRTYRVRPRAQHTAARRAALPPQGSPLRNACARRTLPAIVSQTDVPAVARAIADRLCHRAIAERWGHIGFSDLRPGFGGAPA